MTLQTMVDLLDLQHADGKGLRLLRSEYLGTAIHEVSPPSVLADRAPTGITPAFAAVGDWLVLAMSVLTRTSLARHVLPRSNEPWNQTSRLTPGGRVITSEAVR